MKTARLLASAALFATPASAVAAGSRSGATDGPASAANVQMIACPPGGAELASTAHPPTGWTVGRALLSTKVTKLEIVPYGNGDEELRCWYNINEGLSGNDIVDKDLAYFWEMRVAKLHCVAVATQGFACNVLAAP